MSNDESLKETGRCAAAVLVEMVAALECDYDRLEELRAERDSYERPEPTVADLTDAAYNLHADQVTPAMAWVVDNRNSADELAELESAAGECTSREDAETRIQEDALSVEVRSGWVAPSDGFEPCEFQILLSTGGPASRIMGELDEHNEPARAWLEVQDWGTPWTQYFDIEQDTLLAYARCFYFGEG